MINDISFKKFVKLIPKAFLHLHYFKKLTEHKIFMTIKHQRIL